MISGYEVSSLKLTEISEQLGRNKTTVFRLLHTLEVLNHIIKTDKHYELHPIGLGTNSVGGSNLFPNLE